MTLNNKSRIYSLTGKSSFPFERENKNKAKRSNMKSAVVLLLGALALVRPSFATELPPEYKSVGWIESSGTQWINTEFTPSCTDRVVTKIRFWAFPSHSYYAVFCARGEGNSNTFTCFRSTIKGYLRFDRNAGTTVSSFAPVVGKDHCITMDANTRDCFVGDEKVATCGTEGTFTVGSPFVLFASHSGTIDDAHVSYKSSMRLYYFRVYDSSGNIKASLEPCRRKSDNKPGLYDLQNGRFLANSGTGEFDAPLITRPPGFTAMKWIESSGSQYIDTGYTPFCTDRIVTRFHIVNTEQSSWQALYCARAGGVNTFTCQLGKTGGVPGFRFDYNTGTRGWSGVVSNKCEYVLDVDGDTQTYMINGTILTGIGTVAGDFDVGSSLHLFGTESGINLGAYRLYSFQVYSKDGLLMCNCVPYKRDSDGKVGLYDLINNRFLVNAGSGTFGTGGYCFTVTFH